METFDPSKKPKLNKITGLLKKSGVIAVLVIAIPVIGIGSVYNIQEQEQAVLTTLGSAKTVAEPGLHFKIPFIQRVQKVNTTIQGVAIGYDNRHMSSEFARESAAVLASHGITSYVFETLRPTPELSFAVRNLNCFGGIMITASHNPL